MIQFLESEVSGYYHNIQGGGYVLRYGGAVALPFVDLAEVSFFLTASDPGLRVEHERRLGNRPVHGMTVRGRMRDKEVSHLNAYGQIQLPRTTHVVDSDPLWGLPRVKTTAGTYYVVSPPLSWGEEALIERIVPSYTYLYGGQSFRVETGRGKWYIVWSGDKAVLVSELDNPQVTRVSNESVYIAASRKGTIWPMRRAGGRIYRFPMQTKTDDYFTGVERQAALTSVPSTGGTIRAIQSWTMVDYGSTASMIDDITFAIARDMQKDKLQLDFHPTDFGDLALECSAQTRFVDQNVLSLIFDVDDWRHIHTLWKNLTNTSGWRSALRAFNRVKSGKGHLSDLPEMFKPGSSTYLFGKYAVLPSVSDIRRLVAGAERSASYLHRQRLHSRRVTVIDDPTALSALHTAVMTVQCDTYPTSITGAMQWFIGEWKKWGLFPSVTNLWDILPYSFVVDWIVQYGDLFKDVDAYLETRDYFPIEYVVMSEKWEKTKSISKIAPQFSAATGNVTYSYYVRWISSELPLPTVSLEAESTAGLHLLESTALVIQRL